ncbi:hypothetical protein BDV27DRAFT_90688 [Aspergillus caelatus]|uniref:Uncharacterized protein n=1 Tax=Aspergillus caelatus TaxID=61420 RepID=A0A5N7ABE1_9EURO|nr:uncharacterized protein BDV27DRAFT_90688 [Aspergillus caelatus]KAE8366476.1 hypothetical protein BDV27DRAFT_90688 [Aspergillus caelatus]
MVELSGDLIGLGDPSDVALSPTLISVLKILGLYPGYVFAFSFMVIFALKPAKLVGNCSNDGDDNE